MSTLWTFYTKPWRASNPSTPIARPKTRLPRIWRSWLTDEQFAAYRPQIEWLIETKQFAGLLDRFYQILPFGTGGRRGAVGIGPNRMNLWTLGASVQGHCEYLKERFPGAAPWRVVLAYDVPPVRGPTKELQSGTAQSGAAPLFPRFRQFMPPGSMPPTASRRIFCRKDSTRYLATPELSFTIRLLGAHGGLNISASHNPPDDNGGKFYDERGGQPVPPDDQIMADLVDQVTLIKELPWADAVRAGKIVFLDEAPHKAYIDLCRKQSLVDAAPVRRNPGRLHAAARRRSMTAHGSPRTARLSRRHRSRSK